MGGEDSSSRVKAAKRLADSKTVKSLSGDSYSAKSDEIHGARALPLPPVFKIKSANING